MNQLQCAALPVRADLFAGIGERLHFLHSKGCLISTRRNPRAAPCTVFASPQADLMANVRRQLPCCTFEFVGLTRLIGQYEGLGGAGKAAVDGLISMV